MTLSELTKKVITKSIRSAACIDDEYLGPYEDSATGFTQDKPSELYHSFRKDANCDIDIYRYVSYDQWSEDKKFVLNSKDLLILDWELDKELPIKYQNTIKILEEAIKSPFIHYIIIHTHANDADLIYKNILFNFLFNSKKIDLETKSAIIEQIFNTIKDKLIDQSTREGESFDEEEFEENKDEFESILDEIINGYAINLKMRNSIIVDFYSKLNDKFGITTSSRIIKKVLEEWGVELESFFTLLDMQEYFNQDKLIDDTEKEYSIKEIEELDSPTLFINSAFITIFAKENAGESSTLPKINVNEVFSSFTNCIINLANNSISSIIALELKDVYRINLASFGKGLAGIDERALIYQLNRFDTIEGKYEYLLNIWNNQVNLLTIQSSDINYLPKKDHFDSYDEVKSEEIESELANLASNIMLSNHTNLNRMIQFGDIFITDHPLRVYDGDEINSTSYKYLICITPACDCIRPKSKINNNFSFLHGQKTNIKSALEHSETGYFTFLQNGNVIKWSDKPFTIYIVNSNLNALSTTTFKYNERTLKMEYLTTMKEMFAQRISNNAFSNNIRIGVDLPITKK